MGMRKPMYPKEILDYAGTIFEDLPIDRLSQEQSELVEELPPVDDEFDFGGGSIAQAKKGLENFEKMSQDGTLLKDESLPKLERSVLEDEAQAQKDEMKAIEARSAQIKKDFGEGTQEVIPEVSPVELQEKAPVRITAGYEEQVEKGTKEEPSYEERIMEATKQKRKKEDLVDILEAMSPTNAPIFERMRKSAGKDLEELTLEKKLQEEKLKKDAEIIKLVRELKEQKAISDPNSDISRFTRDFLIKMGMTTLKDYPDVSYSQLKERFPDMMKTLQSQFESEAKIAESRGKLETAQKKLEQQKSQFDKAFDQKERTLDMNRQATEINQRIKLHQIETTSRNLEETRNINQFNKEEAKKRSYNEGAYKRAKEMKESQVYEVYRNSDDAIAELDDLIKRVRVNKGKKLTDEERERLKIPQGSILFKYGKLAQMDSSVLRESDIRTLVGGNDYTSYKEFMERLTSKLSGQQFTERDLEAMKKVLISLKKQKGRRLYEDYYKPLKTYAEVNKVDLSTAITPRIFEDIAKPYIEEEQAAEDAKTIEEARKKINALKNQNKN